jgi:hypothetical protein
MSCDYGKISNDEAEIKEIVPDAPSTMEGTAKDAA